MFITFEGPEGSGKTSVIHRLYETLLNLGYRFTGNKREV